jgi:hypothetical protein
LGLAGAHDHATRENRDCESQKTDGPLRRLGRQAKQRLHQHGIKQKRRERTEITGSVEEVGIGGMRMTCAPEPGLQKRRVGGNGKERQTDARGEDAEEPEIGIALGRRRGGGR